MEPVPKVETINKMVDAIMPKRTPYNQAELDKKVKQAQSRVHFNIPGMPTMEKK